MNGPDYGTDLSVYPVDAQRKPTGRGIGRVFALVSGRDNLVEALMKRLETPKGWLARFHDPNSADYETFLEYGHDISNILETGFTPVKLLAEEVAIQVEMEKDDRVKSAEVHVNLPLRTSVLKIEIRITPKTGTGIAPFKMILGPGDVLSLQLLQVTSG